MTSKNLVSSSPPPLPPVELHVDGGDEESPSGEEHRDAVERAAEATGGCDEIGGKVANCSGDGHDDGNDDGDGDGDGGAVANGGATETSTATDYGDPPPPRGRSRRWRIVGDGGARRERGAGAAASGSAADRGTRAAASADEEDAARAKPVRRKRGRPPGKAAASADGSSPRENDDEEEAVRERPTRRKRGRPPGSGNKKKATARRHTFVFDSEGALGMGIEETDSGGCFVSDVAPDGTAHGLGLRRGDVIVLADNLIEEGDGAGDERQLDPNSATTPTTAVAFDEFVQLSQRRPLRITVTRCAAAAAPPPRERQKRKRAGKSSQRLDEAVAAHDEAKEERSLASTERSEAQVEFDRAKERLDAAVARDEASESRLSETAAFLEQERFLLFRPDWDVMYRRLCDFKERHGHTWVKPCRKSRSKKRGGRKSSEEGPPCDEGGPMTEGEGEGSDDEDDEDNAAAEGDENDNAAAAPAAGSAGDDSGPVDESTRREQLAEKKFRKWVDFQRRACRRYLTMNDEEREAFGKQLTAEQFHLLRDEVGLIMSHQEYLMGPQWDELYEKLAAFRLQHGHCNARKSGRNDDRMRLGIWVDRQRKFFEEGKLPQDKVDKLEKLGFDFEVGPKKPAAFGDMLERLKEYKEEHGDCYVPYAWKEDEELAFWVTYQRSKGNKGRLSPDEFGALHDLGFVFNVREARWNQWLAEIEAYRDEFGDCNVRRAPGPHLKLGNWCHHIRNQYTRFKDGQKSEITEDRIRQLEALGFSFRLQGTRQREAALKTEEEIWRDRYDLLKEYRDTHGHTRASSRQFPIKSKLKSWVALQRSQYKAFQEGRPTTMTEERIRLLKQLSFDLTQGYTASS